MNVSKRERGYLRHRLDYLAHHVGLYPAHERKLEIATEKLKFHGEKLEDYANESPFSWPHNIKYLIYHCYKSNLHWYERMEILRL